jgi:hypothetical protein
MSVACVMESDEVGAEDVIEAEKRTRLFKWAPQHRAEYGKMAWSTEHFLFASHTAS